MRFASSAWKLVAVSLFAVMLIIAACGGQPQQGSDTQAGADTEQTEATDEQADTDGSAGETEPSGEGKEPVRFFDGQWQTLWINNAIARFIIEEGYGYPVEIVQTTTPVMQQSLPSGELDVNMELWRTNIIDWYNEETGAGNIIDLGPTFEKSTQGWYVPAFVVKGDPERGIEPSAPNLESVLDLPEYTDVFPDPENPEKGLLVNCITGWQCAKINRIKLHAYGLADDYNVQEPGAAAALDAALAGAVQKGEPVLAYYWEPTWLVGTYDLIQLKEPEYTEACNAEIQKALNDEIPVEEVREEAGCAYQSFAVHKGVYAGFKERAPEVAAFLDKMNVGTDPLNRASAFMEAESVEADRAALWFFEEYQERWREWLPDDVESKVEDALLEAGAEL